LNKYNLDGDLLWTKTLRNDADDLNVHVDTDPLGNVFVGGTTWGALEGTNAGQSDVFAAKYDGDGNVQWTAQFGTSDEDEVYGISANGLGNTYLTGRLGAAGSRTSTDAFVAKFDSAGSQLWTSFLGAADDFDLGAGVYADGLGNVYAVGFTPSDLQNPPGSNGGIKAFVAKLNDNGDVQWAEILDSDSSFDSAANVVVDAEGIVHVVGTLELSASNAFIAKYDPDGTFLGMQEFDSGSSEGLQAVDVFGPAIYAVGSTRGSLFGTNGGNSDAILVRVASVPEPASGFLAALALITSSLDWRRRRG